MVNVTYPGVYIEDVGGTASSITGVATNVTAFLGRAPRGPVNEPVDIRNQGDYERTFGQLNLDSTISYTVRDFFNNGGAQGLVVRLYEPHFETPAARQSAQDLGRKLFEAASDSTTIGGALDAAESAFASARATCSQLQADAGQRFLAKLKLFRDQHPDASETTTPALIDGMKAALGVAAPQGAAEVVLSIANTVRTAALQVAEDAYSASLVAADDATSVLKSARESAAHFNTVLSAHDAAQGIVAAVQAEQHKGNKTPPGLFAGQMAVFRVPFVMNTVLAKVQNLGKNPNNTIKAAYGAFQADLTGLTKVQDAAQKSGATYASVVAAAKHNLRRFGPALAALPHDTPAFDVARHATEVVAKELCDIWPDRFCLLAANPGAWGNRLTVSANVTGITEDVAAAVSPDLTAADLFNLVVVYDESDGTVISESLLNVTLHPDGGTQRLDRVLQQQSTLLRLPQTESGEPEMPESPPVPDASGKGVGGTESLQLSMTTYLGDAAAKTGLYALNKAEAFNILTIPPDQRRPGSISFGDTPNLVYQTAAKLCADRRAMLIIDPPGKWLDDYKAGNIQSISTDDLGSYGTVEGESSAVYFPRLLAVDPLRKGRNVAFPASGALAGIWASTDYTIGVWKAPAGLTAAVNGVVGPEVSLNDVDNGVLNPLGINCLRNFNIGGTVVWGARTLRGSDLFASEYKYIPVRRTLLYIESSLLQGTGWAVFEANDEKLWSSLRLQVGDFMDNLFRQGAFMGTSASNSYFVNCDATTTSSVDQLNGVVNIQVGFAPAYPAEFVVFTIQQKIA